jgi:peptide/nickel transport system permease protein
LATLREDTQTQEPDIVEGSGTKPAIPRRKPWWTRLIRNPTAMFGVVILMIVAIFAIFAPILAPNVDPNFPTKANPLQSNLPPFSPGHPLGTDLSGRDMWAIVVYGARIPLIVGGLAVVIAGTIGIVLGLLSGYYGKWVDDLISWLSNVQLAFPNILLVIAIVAALGRGVINMIIVLGFTGWVVFARIVRGETLALREREFIEAGRAIGLPTRKILFRHILPNVVTSLTVIGTFEIARVILVEAALSFLSLGVDNKTASWGLSLADNKGNWVLAWYLPVIPGLCISLTVLAINLVGDWLREEFDPRLQS